MIMISKSSVSKLQDGAGPAGVYRPPKFAPTSIDEDKIKEGKKCSEKGKRDCKTS